MVRKALSAYFYGVFFAVMTFDLSDNPSLISSLSRPIMTL